MGTTLFPFRYIQLARHLFKQYLDSVPQSRKGKGRAYPLDRIQAPLVRSVASAPESQQHHQHHATPSDVPAAGPSNNGESSRVLRPDPTLPPEPSEIYKLMNDERLLVPGAAKPPREIVVLCHGLYGFSTSTPIPLFPSLKLHYWASVLEVLRDRMGCKVMVVGVKGTGSIEERAEQMHQFLKEKLPKGTGVNFVAHSMGGLDVRHLISTIKPTTYTPLSLTSIGVPHRGSPFMDWCAANIGVGSAAQLATAAIAAKGLPFSLKAPLLSRVVDKAKEQSEEKGVSGFTSALTQYLLNIFDSPAYGNLTTGYLRDHFNPNTPDSLTVKYTSVAGRIKKMSPLHPLWFPKLVLDGAAEKGYSEDNGYSGKDYEGNDGLVSLSSAKWGEYIGSVDECHHWDLRGEGGLWPNGATSVPKPEGRPDQNKPGGWDWEGGGVAADLGLESQPPVATPISTSSSSSSSSASSSSSSSTSTTSSSSSSSTSSTSTSASSAAEKESQKDKSWDVAQVGQILDWVTNQIPGTGRDGSSSITQIGRKQLDDLKRSERVNEAAGFLGLGTTTVAKRDEKEREEKRKKEKFDLVRFYGGLMLKLREDGF